MLDARSAGVNQYPFERRRAESRQTESLFAAQSRLRKQPLTASSRRALTLYISSLMKARDLEGKTAERRPPPLLKRAAVDSRNLAQSSTQPNLAVKFKPAYDSYIVVPRRTFLAHPRGVSEGGSQHAYH
jgi:uncharacterized protein YciW